jgi:hypothetical protein
MMIELIGGCSHNKYIIGTTRHLLEDIHITTRIPLQKVRSYRKLGHHN